MRALLGLSVAGGVLGAIGGALFGLLHGGTSYHRSIAYGLYIAAAVILVATPLAGSRRFYRSTSLPLVEGWVFVSVSIVLCAVGALIDVAGS